MVKRQKAPSFSVDSSVEGLKWIETVIERLYDSPVDHCTNQTPEMQDFNDITVAATRIWVKLIFVDAKQAYFPTYLAGIQQIY